MTALSSDDDADDDDANDDDNDDDCWASPSCSFFLHTHNHTSEKPPNEEKFSFFLFFLLQKNFPLGFFFSSSCLTSRQYEIVCLLDSLFFSVSLVDSISIFKSGRGILKYAFLFKFLFATREKCERKRKNHHRLPSRSKFSPHIQIISGPRQHQTTSKLHSRHRFTGAISI